jgi:hypothetical protein
MNLEYFIASLPMLLPGHPPGMTLAAFRTACAEHLGGRLREAVQALLDDQVCNHPFVNAWRNHETSLRNTIARRRAVKKDVDAQPWLHPDAGAEARIEQGVAAAFEQPDPLQRERALNRLRWQAADSLQGLHPLAAEVVLAYAIKLRLLTQWHARNAETGQARLEALATLP